MAARHAPRCRRRRAATATTTTASPGSATPTFALWGMYSLGFDWEAVDFFSFIADVAERDDDLQIMYGIGGERELAGVRARPPAGVRRVAPGADRQRGVRPAAARRLGRAARLGVPALQGGRPPRQPDLADPREAGRRGAQALARAGRRHLGGARRAAALHVVEDHVLGRGRPRRAAGPHDGRGRQGGASGSWRPRRSRTTSSSNGVDERGVLTQYYGSTALDASLLLAPLRALPAAGRPADPRDGAGDPRRADRRRPGAALPGRGDRRRLPRRGGHVHDLLVLAGLGTVRDRRDRARRASCARSCCRSPGRSSSTPRRSTRTAASTWATSPRRSPTWP